MKCQDCGFPFENCRCAKGGANPLPVTQTAPDFLHRAADIMTERSMGKCMAAFNVVTGYTLTEAEAKQKEAHCNGR